MVHAEERNVCFICRAEKLKSDHGSALEIERTIRVLTDHLLEPVVIEVRAIVLAKINRAACLNHLHRLAVAGRERYVDERVALKEQREGFFHRVDVKKRTELT